MKSLLIAICLVVFTSSVFSQASFAKLEKNRNNLAKGLYHELNRAKDTLLLKSNLEISQVYSLNSENEREIDMYLNSRDIKIPISNLSSGKHVVIVNQSPKKILFVIHVFGAGPLMAIDD
ncbi:MAG TPA: hypothetical protein VKY41_00975 [Xanthomarina sp.]|nr:hypothetical protein [Xanthomarina sp.]